MLGCCGACGRLGIGPNPRCWCAECGRAARSGSESFNSIAISMWLGQKSVDRREHVSHSRARPCGVAWCVGGRGGRGGGGGWGGGGAAGRTAWRAVTPRGARHPHGPRACPVEGGENQAAGRAQPRVRRLAGAGMARGVARGGWCVVRGVWCVARGVRVVAAGSEVVRDELIGGLENTDKWCSSFPRAGRAGGARRRGVGCAGGAWRGVGRSVGRSVGGGCGGEAGVGRGWPPRSISSADGGVGTCASLQKEALGIQI